MKKFILISLFPLYLFSNIKHDIREKIIECQLIRENMSYHDHFDVYIYYYLYGMEDAYKNCLDMIKHKDK